MSASLDDYKGLEEAIAKALAKERKAMQDRGEREIHVNYIAMCMIPGRMHKIEHSNFQHFEHAVISYHKSFPKIPIVICSFVDVR